MIKFKQLLLANLLFFLNTGILFAQMEGDGEDLPAPGEAEGAFRTPIDMYEGMLLGMALLMIIGYYLYSRNRRIANS